MKPLPLRTVRPFVIDSVVLTEVADDEDIDLTDQLSIAKFLKSRVSFCQ
jgi:double-strand break repair protein MRE11